MNSDYLDDDIKIKSLLLRYLTFWPIILVSVIFFIILSYTYLRYADYQYSTTARIEIIDKAQDSEMALPTAMTIFNRSMINLDNEIGVLKSFKLNRLVGSSIKSNVAYFTEGKIKSTRNHSSEFFFDYDIEFIQNTDSITSFFAYHISLDNKNSKMLIEVYDKDDNKIDSYNFNDFNTKSSENNLPFILQINQISYYEDEIEDNLNKIIEISAFENSVNNLIKNLEIIPSSPDSDQLTLSMVSSNKEYANEYINTLISFFDQDGILDRQLEYQRTMDFVDTRAVFLLKELEQIEIQKQNYKEKNNLSNVISDTQASISQKFTYDSELFIAQSQKDLLSLLSEELAENEFNLLPVDIGLENNNINTLINQYNISVNERNKFLQTGAGLNNPFIVNLDNQIKTFYSNILKSIDAYNISLNKKIQNIMQKEEEFENVFKGIPEKEKILRSIERKLEIKESLYILLLQKREEAAINNAVVKPSIKIIDNSISKPNPVSPNRNLILLLGFSFGIILPIIIISTYFYFDNKIHTKTQLSDLLKRKIPIISEIPFVDDISLLFKIMDKNSRNILSESIRMIVANLNFMSVNKDQKKYNNRILVTSSIKGEGKTLVSINFAASLSHKYKKVLLIGADLRNPQLHKFLNISKSEKGLSDYIYRDDLNWKDLLIKNENLDILISGTIPPNPTQLLSSDVFSKFLDEVSDLYDFVVIDSAPCLLVSDTFEISNYIGSTLYLVRANHTDRNLTSFISEIFESNKLKNINIIFNSVGSSGKYGYKYGYQYGYQYGYKYGYNYGYGYGYGNEENS